MAHHLWKHWLNWKQMQMWQLPDYFTEILRLDESTHYKQELLSYMGFNTGNKLYLFPHRFNRKNKTHNSWKCVCGRFLLDNGMNTIRRQLAKRNNGYFQDKINLEDFRTLCKKKLLATQTKLDSISIECLIYAHLPEWFGLYQSGH